MSDIEDKWAIHEIVSEYCFCVDGRRWAQLRDLFTDDAEWAAPYAHARSGDEVIRVMDSLIPPPGTGPKRKHLVSNLAITLGANTAAAVSTFIVVRQSGAGIVPSVAGTYVDELRKENGTWKFRKRNVRHDLMGDLGLRTD